MGHWSSRSKGLKSPPTQGCRGSNALADLVDCTHTRFWMAVGSSPQGPSPSSQRVRTSVSGRAAEACRREKRPTRGLATLEIHAVPVRGSMALGFDGEYYNINADEMAAACAAACKADALVFLTDVPGVRGANGETMRWLSIDQIAEMAKSGVITGGMLPKLSACRDALLRGVKRVRILPAESAKVLPDLCTSRVSEGTEVMVA